MQQYDRKSIIEVPANLDHKSRLPVLKTRGILRFISGRLVDVNRKKVRVINRGPDL
jgi:hypothetical protein